MLRAENSSFILSEKAINSNMYSCIDDNKSFIYNAGAGTGKTHALIECLRYVYRQKEKELRECNQRIICITYTNVAAQQIKQKIGATDYVWVSTIHEFMWEILKNYQELLLEIHVENLQGRVEKLEKNLALWFKAMPKSVQAEFEKNLIDNIKDYYDIKNKNAVEFRAAVSWLFSDFGSYIFPIKNVVNFKTDCDNIILLTQFKDAILSIQRGEDGYTRVSYNSRNNMDRLQYMEISHNTLLEYSKILIEKYPVLKRIIVDQFPYFFIDEYQDTSNKVVEMMNSLLEYGIKINHPVMVGYFGDEMQNIYDRGVGSAIYEYINDFKEITNSFNHRSCQEIIRVANKIRNDDKSQLSIFNDAYGGSVKFFYGDEQSVESFVEENSKELRDLNKEHRSVHCFLLLNKYVASYSGIAQLYDWFADTPYYKSRHTAVLSTELLCNDLYKLGEIERYIFNLTEFVIKISKKDTALVDIFPRNCFDFLNVNSMQALVEALKSIKGNSFMDIIHSLEGIKERAHEIFKDEKAEAILINEIDDIVGLKDFSYEVLKSRIQEKMFMKEYAGEQVDALFAMPFDIFIKWHSYLTRDYKEDVIFHTFHSIKGLEFDDVIIVFDDRFAGIKDFFTTFFEKYNQEDSPSIKRYCQARNLLYVAITRAKSNVRILYTGDYKRNSGSIKTIFGEVHNWDKEKRKI